MVNNVNLLDEIEDKIEILNKLNLTKWMNIVISGIIWIASMIITSMYPLLFSPIFGINAFIAIVSILLELKYRLIDGDSLEWIIIMHGMYGLVYSIVYSFVSI